jgi:hypothetical protein
MTNRQPSNAAMDATISAICSVWAKKLESAYRPGMNASELCSALSELDGYNEDMLYLWIYANPALVIKAKVQAHP